MEDFEKMLTELSKPEVKELKHQDMLAHEIARAKNRNALSIWWILIPFYILAALFMKTTFVKTSLKYEVNLLRLNSPAMFYAVFLVLPLVVIAFNGFFSVRRTKAGIILIILSSIILLTLILCCYV